MSALALRQPYRPAFVVRAHGRALVTGRARVRASVHASVHANVGAELTLATSSASRATTLTEATALTPPDTSTRDLAVYVGAPSLGGLVVGGLLGGLPGALIVALLAGGGGYWWLHHQQAQAEAGRDLCAAELPEPARTQALAALAGTDTAKLDSMATQSDARGWHCAAKEMRARKSVLVGGPDGGKSGKKKFGGVPDPAWPFGTACEPALAKLPDTARTGVGGTVLASLRTIAGDAVKTNDATKIRNVAAILADPSFADAYKFAADCLNGRATTLEAARYVVEEPGSGAAPPMAWPAEIDVLPAELRAEAITVLASTPHNVDGWKSGGAALFTKLRDLGYKDAAQTVIATYLPEGPDPGTPGRTFLSAAEGGA